MNAAYFPFLEARALFIELAYYGPDVLNYAHGFAGLIEGVEGEKRDAAGCANRKKQAFERTSTRLWTKRCWAV